MLLADDHEDFLAIVSRLLEPEFEVVKTVANYLQAGYPYADLVNANCRRSRQEFEYELIDTGLFGHDRYFDVFVEYANPRGPGA